MNIKKYLYSYKEGRITTYSRKQNSTHLENVAKTCTEFDSFYEQFGFSIPEHTSIIIAEHKLYDFTGQLATQGHINLGLRFLQLNGGKKL